MNFTREPIIETIITPREGYKLLVKSSKGVEGEGYLIDALEVVSFGPAIFYRSIERQKPFLVPVADFEVIEVKETRIALKHVNLERTIKIGGGKEAKSQPTRSKAEIEETKPQVLVEEKKPQESRHDKKRDRRHRRRRRAQEGASIPQQEEKSEGGEVEAEAHSLETPVDPALSTVPPVFASLFPPPPTLISEKLGRLREQSIPEALSPQQEPEQEQPVEERKEELVEKNSDTEINDLFRVSSLTSTSYHYSGFSSTGGADYFLKT